jgi:hypothetical protein
MNNRGLEWIGGCCPGCAIVMDMQVISLIRLIDPPTLENMGDGARYSRH